MTQIQQSQATSLGARTQYEGISTEDVDETPLPFKPHPQCVVSGPASTPISQPLRPWKPRYFRRRTLIVFVLLFLAIVAALQALQAVSRRNHGIASSHAGLRYLWTYLPVVLLTLVATLWGRVEHQTKMISPWVAMSQRPEVATRSLLLDYISMSTPQALYRSIKSGNVSISAAIVISILLKILIILSTGLITLSPTVVSHQSTQIVLEDSFITEPPQNVAASTLPWHVMQGLIAGNITFPPGTSQDFAYQTISRSGVDGSAEIRATVNALESGLRCQPADLTLHYSAPPNTIYRQKTNFTVTTPDCSAYFDIYGPNWPVGQATNTTVVQFARLETGQCKDTSDDGGRRVLIILGQVNYTVDYSHSMGTNKGGEEVYEIRGQILESTQLLCEPTYNLTQVDVMRSGIRGRDSVTEVPQPSKRTIEPITAWDIMDAHFGAFDSDVNPRFSNGYPTGGSVNISQTPIDIASSPYMEMALGTYFSGNVTFSSLFDPSVLESIVSRYYRQFAAIVAKQRVMTGTIFPNQTISGSITATQNRLIVREWSTQLISGIVIVCAALAIAMLFCYPSLGGLPRNPASLAAVACLTAQSPSILSVFRNAGAADETAFTRYLAPYSFHAGIHMDPSGDRGKYQIVEQMSVSDNHPNAFPQSAADNRSPIALRFASRSALLLVIIGLILALELTLRKSQQKSCLGLVQNDTHIHYAWTATPAIVFGLLALVLSITDFEIRKVLPYTALKQGVTAQQFVALEFLDRALPGRLYQQLKLKSFPGVSASITVFLASFFTVFAGALFQARPHSVTAPIQLMALKSFPETVNSYTSRYQYSGFGMTASLILAGFFDGFPQWTWEDLAFPTYGLVEPWPESLDSEHEVSDVLLDAVVPAVRLRTQCRKYSDADMRVDFLPDYTGDSITKFKTPLAINITGEECKFSPQLDSLHYMYNVFFSTNSSAYFGQGGDTDFVSTTQGCSELLYAWGHIDHAADPPVSFVSAIGCNRTLETVDIEMKLRGRNFTIDEAPTRREETTRPAALKMFVGGNSIFSYIYEAPPSNAQDNLNQVFAILTDSAVTSNINASSLGDRSQADAVADALQLQYRYIVAQELGSNREPSNITNATLPIDAPTNTTDDEFAYNVTATNQGDSLCVTQDAVSTHILAGTLALTALLLIIGWVTLPETDVLPRSPTTIASAMAVIAGGNLFNHLPEDAQWCSDKRLTEVLDGDLQVTMGWGNMPDVDGMLLNQENEAGVSRFGIFVTKRS